MSQICSKVFKYGLMAGQETEVTASRWRLAVTVLERWDLALSSIYACLVASGWLSKCGRITGCKTSLMYWSPARLGCLVWWLNPACSHERYTPSHYWASTARISSNQWILRNVLKFQPRCAKNHAKRDRRCRSANSGRLMILLSLSPADYRRF